MSTLDSGAMKSASKSALTCSGWLTLGTAAIWLVCLAPAYAFTGRRGIEDTSVFAVGCLLPGWLVFWIVSRYRVATSRAFAVLSGTGVRIVFAAVAIVCIQLRRGHVDNNTLLWLVWFYLVTLAIETTLLVCCAPKADAG